MKNPKTRYLEIQRDALLGRLSALLSQLDNPDLTREQLDAVSSEVDECRAKMRALQMGSLSEALAEKEAEASEAAPDASERLKSDD